MSTNMPKQSAYGRTNGISRSTTKYGQPKVELSPKGKFLLSRMKQTEGRASRPEDMDVPDSDQGGDAE